jgi:hypothetical protein
VDVKRKILAGGALAVGAAGVIWVAVLRRNEPSLGAGLNAVLRITAALLS